MITKTSFRKPKPKPQIFFRFLSLILIVLLNSWPEAKIQEEFSCSNYMVRKVKDNGILLSLNAKPGKVLDKTTVELVKNYYYSNEISKPMPGKINLVIIVIDREKTQVERRLVLSNLKEIYVTFKDQFTNVRIGFLFPERTKFVSVQHIRTLN